MATETEIKVEVSEEEFNELRRRIRKNSRELTPRLEEKNTLFDQGTRLRDQGGTLRLRTYGDRSILTYKGPLDEQSPFKQRAEFETDVEGAVMRSILDALGFEPVFRYDKFREKRSWQLQDGEVEVCFDETPVGHFLEVEGDEELLHEAARKLGWTEDQFIKKSYVEIYKERS